MRSVDCRSAISFRSRSTLGWQVIIGAAGLLLTTAVTAADDSERLTGELRLAQAGAGTSAQVGSSERTSSDIGASEQQESPAQSKDTKTSHTKLEIEEVIVTATKRQESVQKLPQAITAITADRLDQLNAQTFDDYFRDVPGLMRVVTEPTKRDFSLRGVGSGNVTANANTIDVSTVAQYFDDISVTAGGFQVDPHLVDIERIEVLRGPQGTLYGEGALGGMIRIVTRRPELDNFSASAEGRISSTQDGGVSNDESMTFNLPIVSGIAALRLNGFYSDDAGFLDSVYRDSDTGAILGTYKEDYDSARAKGVRGQFLLKPNEAFSVLAQVIHSESRTTFGSYFPDVGDLIYSVDTCHVQPPPPPPPEPGQPPPPPPDVSNLPLSDTCVGGSYPSRSETADLYNLTLEGDLGWASLVSSSSYGEVSGDVKLTEINTIAGPLRTYSFQLQDQKTFIQELRLVSSKSWSDRWDYVLGAFYQDKDALYTYPPLFGGGPQATFISDRKTEETALFVDGGYMLTPHLQARLGLRVSDLSNDATIKIDDPMGDDVQPASPSSSFSPAPVTGRAVLTYFINPEMLTYTSVARGFRNGTLNNTLVNYSPTSQEPGFEPVPASSDPDTVVTYELGWKLSFPSLRATLNGAFFHSDWKDMQVQSFKYLFPDEDLPDNGFLPQDRFRPIFVNAARSRIDGVELEGSMQLTRGLQARVSFSFIDAVLTEDFPLYDVTGNPVLHGVKGDRIPFVARTSGSASLSYHRPVFDTFDGFVDLNAQYQGSRATDFNRVLNTPPEQGGTSPIQFPTYYLLKSYWTTGMQIGVQNAQWRAALYANNLLNDRADLFHSGDSQVTIRPRTFGLFVRYNFD